MILVGTSSSGYSVIHCLHRCQAISTRSCRMSGSTSIPASPKSPASSYLTPASKSPPTPISMENSKVQRQSSVFYPDSLKPWQTVLLVPETPMSICHEKTSGREVGSSSQLCSPPSLLLPNAADRHGGRRQGRELLAIARTLTGKLGRAGMSLDLDGCAVNPAVNSCASAAQAEPGCCKAGACGGWKAGSTSSQNVISL